MIDLVPVIAAAISLLGSVATAIFARYFTGQKEALSDKFDVRSRLDKMEVKVDTLWAFQIRRGIVEGVNNDSLKLNSPATLTESGKKMFAHISASLGSWYALRGKNMKDLDAMIDLEMCAGERLVKEVCIPFKISHGACLIGALAAAKAAAGFEAIVDISPEDHSKSGDEFIIVPCELPATSSSSH